MCVWVAYVGEGLPEASHLMTRSSTPKTVTDSGCVVIAGGSLTARKQTKIKLLKQKNSKAFFKVGTNATAALTDMTDFDARRRHNSSFDARTLECTVLIFRG